MLGNLDEMQKAGKLQLDTASKSTMHAMKGAQRMASEAAELTREGIEKCSNYFERITGVKSVEEAIRINNEFATANWERFFAGATKMTECCASVAKDVTAPVREATVQVTSPPPGRANTNERIRAAS